MIFKNRRGTPEASATSGDIVYSTLFDERIGRMPAAPALSAREALRRWESGLPFSVLPANGAGAVVEWSISARGGGDYVVNRYAPDGRRVQSVRWEQIGERVRRAGGTALFGREAGSDQGPGVLCEVRWRTYHDGSTRIETIGSAAAEDDVITLRRVVDRSGDLPAPALESVVELRHADDVAMSVVADSDPRAAAAQYVRALSFGATPDDADEVFGEASLRDGAVLLATSRQIAEVVDRVQREGAPSSDTFVGSRIAVLRRGRASVVPLGAQGSLPAHWSSVAAQLRDLAGSIRGALEFRAGQGVPVNLAEATSGSYAHALVESGAERATDWRDVPGSAVLLVTAGDPGAGTCSMALHIVPSDWVSHSPTDASADAAWSWSEIVELHR